MSSTSREHASNDRTVLRGTTWAHSRGYVPLVACGEAWSEFHAGLDILWEKRSLWAFGEGPLEQLADAYDLVVFDYKLPRQALNRAATEIR